jgi:hypothetical protein
LRARCGAHRRNVVRGGATLRLPRVSASDTSISPLANCAKRRADCEFRCSLMSEAKRT